MESKHHYLLLNHTDLSLVMSIPASASWYICQLQQNLAQLVVNIGPAKTLSGLAGWPMARTRPNKINKFKRANDVSLVLL